MDAGLKVEKLARQKQARFAPVQPQVVGRKTHQHGPHAKVKPTRGAQLAHAGVHHGEAGLPFAPGLQTRPVDLAIVHTVTRAQPVGRARKVAKLNRGFIFQLLHEMAMPAQAARETAQSIGQAAVCR